MRTGGCVCGAVRYEAETAEQFGVCYCKMCQRWSSGVYMGVSASAFTVTKGKEALTLAKTSEWANRAFCNLCGSNIYYHAEAFGSPSVALGSLDDTSGLTPHVQLFIDKKPEGFALDAETKTMTEAECMAHFAGEP